MADDTFAEKCAYWREHGMQVATGGLRDHVETVRTADDGHKVREIRDRGTNASVYHHSDQPDRQDVTIRPTRQNLTVTTKGT